MIFSRKQLRNEEQRYYLSAGGVVGEIVFGESEQIEWKGRLIKDFEEIWGGGGFLLRTKPKKIDYQIEFVDEMYLGGKDGLIIRHKGRSSDVYLLLISWVSQNKIRVHYFLGVAELNALLREIYAKLSGKKKYFLLHAATCIDENNVAYLICAKSGGGKSTTAEAMIREGWSPMGGDLLLVRRNKNGWSYESLPLVEKELLPKKKIVNNARVYFIEKTKVAWVKQIRDKIQLVKKVMEQTVIESAEGKEKVSQLVIDWASGKQEAHQLGVALGKTNFKQLMKEGENES